MHVDNQKEQIVIKHFVLFLKTIMNRFIYNYYIPTKAIMQISTIYAYLSYKIKYYIIRYCFWRNNPAHLR